MQMREMVGAIRFAGSEKTIELVETWALARLLAVMVHPERVSEQSTASPAASVIGKPEAARTCWLPSNR